MVVDPWANDGTGGEEAEEDEDGEEEEEDAREENYWTTFAEAATARWAEEDANRALRDADAVSAPPSAPCIMIGPAGNAAGEPAEKPRPKAQPSSAASDEAQTAAPNSLLVVGDDPISHTLAFLPAKSLCHAGVACKTLHRLAGLRLDRLIEEMNQKCDRQSGGEGGRTKLVRYQAAMDLVDRVRHGLEDHLTCDGPIEFGPNGNMLPRLRTEAKCRGCSSFPRNINNQFFYDHDDDYEIFICCFELGESGSKFEGFVPLRDGGLFVGGNYGATPKWDEMRQFTSDPTDEKFAAIGTSKLSIVAVAVRHSNCDALFLGAASDFTDIKPSWRRWHDELHPRALVLYDVHADSRSSYPDPTGDRVTTTMFALDAVRTEVDSRHVGTVGFKLRFFAPPNILV